MKYSLLILVFLFLGLMNSFSQTQLLRKEKLSIGEIHTIKSDILKEERELLVYLPQNFDKEKLYPVIYVLDGGLEEDFLHIVGLVNFFKLQFNMPDFIVVGIENVDRKRDFTFYTEIEELKEEYPTTGHSSEFIDFLEMELKPYIQSVFNISEVNYLIGQSLGGLIAAEILLKKPELFSHYFIISPSLWWDEGSLLKETPELLKSANLDYKFVYISVGKKEANLMQKEAKNFYADLKKLKNPNLVLVLNEMEKENHATILHNSIYQGFLNLFPYKE